ncbi:hypothetical protein QEN19_002783 [Hanseniaspora menglaensis]
MDFNLPNNKIILTKKPEVIFSKGLRKIKPFYDVRKCTLKGRFFNKTLLQILTDEFRLKNQEEHASDIKNGKYKIYKHLKKAELEEVLAANPNYSNEISAYQDIVSYFFKQNDYYTVSQHKHEPYSLQWSKDEKTDFGNNIICGMDILENNDEYIVVDKPAGLIVHPSASYYENSLTNVLFHGTGQKFYSTYRLDKVTSGVLALGKTSAGAKKFHENILNKNCFKYYLAKVRGQFPGEPMGMDIFTELSNEKEIQGPDQEDFPFKTKIIETSPIYQIDTKILFPKAFSDPKTAESHFQLVSYNKESNESLVLCRPITGRQHQLRIHLLRLGYPIPGDFFYDPENTFYPKKIDFIAKNNDYREKYANIGMLEPLFEDFRKEFLDLVMAEPENGAEYCSECGAQEYSDPPIDEMRIYLHSFRYRIVETEENKKDLCFQTNLPTWAAQFRVV